MAEKSGTPYQAKRLDEDEVGPQGKKMEMIAWRLA